MTEAVFEILNPEGAVKRPETRTTRRAKVANRLKEAIRERVSWKKLEKLLEELEGLL